MLTVFLMLLFAAGLGIADRIRGGWGLGLSPDGAAKKYLGKTVKVLYGAGIALACGVTEWWVVMLCAVGFRFASNLGYGTPIGIYLSDIPLPQALMKHPEFCERFREMLGSDRGRIAATPLISLAFCGALWGLPFLVLCWADGRLSAAFFGWVLAMPVCAALSKRAHPGFPVEWGAWGWWELYRGAAVGVICAAVSPL
jgi:hypothetical protein